MTSGARRTKPAEAASLEAENARLRARVDELEQRFYPPPLNEVPLRPRPPGCRYVLAAEHDVGDGPRQQAWARLQELFTGWAFSYARERHSNFRFQRAYSWEDIPKGGTYTTAQAALDAKRAEGDVPFYDIDKRTAAIAAVQAQRQRIQDRENELFEALPAADLAAHRVWAYRLQVLGDATRPNRPLDRAFQLACMPLGSYDDVLQEAIRIANEQLEREHQVTLEGIPGYRPGGAWTCDQCGYSFDDSASCFTCDACEEANPRSRAAHRRNVELVASDPKYGGSAAADRLIESRRLRLEGLRWTIAIEA